MRGILVPLAWDERVSPGVEAQGLNHWTASKVFCWIFEILCLEEDINLQEFSGFCSSSEQQIACFYGMTSG